MRWGVAAGLAALAGLGWACWPRQVTPAAPLEAAPRHYTATGQVLGLRPMGQSGCQVRVKLHQWSSISAGFSLAEIPQKGREYQIAADLEQCLAVEVALAAQGDPGDPKSPRHINYQARQTEGGGWRLTQNPTAPVGCGGL